MKKLILFCLMLVSQFSFAADITYEGGYQWRFRTHTYYYNQQVVSPWGTAPDASACNALRSAYMAAQPTWVYEGSASVSGIGISARCTFPVRPCSTCSLASPNASPDTAAYTCPSNSSPVSGGCNCNSGFVPQDGQCVVPPDQCLNTQGLTTGYTRLTVQFDNVNVTSSALASFIGQNVTTGVPINGNNCAATGVVQDCGLFKSGTGGNTLVCGLTGSTYTGSTYNGEQTLFGLPQVDPNATPVDQLTKVCPEGQFPGEVNGSQVCVKASGSANTTQSTTTNSDGTSTTTTTTTACVGDKCTSTTTTETKDAQGNSTGTGTSKIEGDKDAFCMANPQAPECKNTKSNFGGTCTSSFTCESEDAVMCAIALDQYKTNCELLKRDENLGQNLASLIDMPLTDLDLDTTSIQAPQAPGSSCSITPFSIPVGMGAFTVDLTHMCAYLSIIKAIVVAFGFVFWTMIVFVR